MSSKVIVQNVNYGASYDDIQRYFSQAGNVSEVLIAIDQNGNSKGIAFVTYTNYKDAVKAISMLSNTIFQNRKINVKIFEEPKIVQNPTPIIKHEKADYNPTNDQYYVQVFQNTCDILEAGHFTDKDGKYHDISEKVNQSISETITVSEDYSIADDISNAFTLMKGYGKNEKQLIYKRIEITHEGTFDAARRIKNTITEVCALNFANGFNPGGNLTSRGSQEQHLCRQSNLYFCIKDQNEMYDFNKQRNNAYCSHYMIFSPNVVVFRNDNYELVFPRRVSVISAPAVNCSSIGDDDRNGVNRCMKNRCRRILQLAMATNNNAIILGAFGCGAFDNKPEDISRIFKELLIDEFYGMFFTKIVFAIKGSPGVHDHTFDAFKKTFNK